MSHVIEGGIDILFKELNWRVFMFPAPEESGECTFEFC